MKLLFALALALSVVVPARAGEPQDIAAFKDGDGRTTLHFITMEDQGDRAVALTAVGTDHGSIRDRITVCFFSKAEWDMFVSLWAKARRLPAPKKGEAATAGSYADKTDDTTLDLNIGEERQIQFLFISGTKAPGHAAITIGAGDQASVGKAVKKVSEFFGK